MMEPTPQPVGESLTVSQQSLIGLLDPDRDYGTLGYQGTVQAIIDGEIFIRPPFYDGGNPILSHAANGVRAKGSGVPDPKIASQGPRAWQRARFLERAAEDFDPVYAALIDACVNDKDPRAIKLFLEYSLGQPQPMLNEGTTDLINKLLDRIAMSSSATVPDYVESTAR